jgi:hypothetical protein
VKVGDFAPTGNLAMSGNIFGCHKYVDERPATD